MFPLTATCVKPKGDKLTAQFGALALVWNTAVCIKFYCNGIIVVGFPETISLDLCLSLSSSQWSTCQAGEGGLIRNADCNWVKGSYRAIGQVMQGKWWAVIWIRTKWYRSLGPSIMFKKSSKGLISFTYKNWIQMRVESLICYLYKLHYTSNHWTGSMKDLTWLVIGNLTN